MIYLTKGGVWLVFSQVVSITSSLGLAIIFARFFSKENYGTYKYILSLAGIISTFKLTGLPAAITQSIARGYDGAFHVGFRRAQCRTLLHLCPVADLFHQSLRRSSGVGYARHPA